MLDMYMDMYTWTCTCIRVPKFRYIVPDNTRHDRRMGRANLEESHDGNQHDSVSRDGPVTQAVPITSNH